MIVTQDHSRARPRAAAGVISLALLAPAAAQFWNPFSGGQRQQRQHSSSSNTIRSAASSAGAADGRRRPAAEGRRLVRRRRRRTRRSPESTAPITSPILVLGDAMADWLAYGLEDAFSEKPEFGVVRKHRTCWPRPLRSAARRRVAADRARGDRGGQTEIHRDDGRLPRSAADPRTRARSDNPGRGQTPTPGQDDPEYQDRDLPESRAKASAAAQNAEMERGKQQPAAPPRRRPSRSVRGAGRAA